MKKSIILLSAAIGIALAFTSCSDNDSPTLDDLAIEKTSVTLSTGESTTIAITSGNGSYTVTSGDNTIAKASIVTADNKQHVLVEAVAKGTAKLTVKDTATDQTKEITVVVNEYFAIDVDELFIVVDQIGKVNITKGYGPYSVSFDEEGVAEAYPDGNEITVSGVAAGVATLTITDTATGENASVTVTVVETLAVDFDEVVLVEGETTTINLSGGSGEYEIEVGDTDIATAAISKNVISITANNIGSTTLTITDSKSGQSIKVTIQVKGSYMFFTTTAPEGRQMQFTIDAKETDQSGVWIDWNNDGIKNVGEQVTVFGEQSNYVANGETSFTIYGNVTKFTGSANGNKYYNLFASIDVSNNKYLQHLDLKISAIEVLDISKNSELTYLDISSNTDLKSLDLSNNNKLTYLSLSGATGIKTLDVSNLQQLETLYCINCNITDLKLGNLPKLKWLRCWNNYLEKLDVTGCPDLYELFCSQNSLTSLDVSKNTKLGELTISRNKNLSSIDLSKNGDLNSFLSEGNGISSEQCASTLQSIPNPEKLKRLYLAQNSLTSLDLTGFTGLTEITCYRNSITGEGAQTLVNSLPLRESGSGAKIIIIDLSRMPSTVAEGNIITKSDVETAVAKNWGVWDNNTGGSNIPYKGS